MVGPTGNKKYIFCRLGRMTTPRLTVVMSNMVIMTFLFVLFSHGLGLACKSKAAPTAFSNPTTIAPCLARGKSVSEFTLGEKTFIRRSDTVSATISGLESKLHIEGSFGT